MARHFLDEQGYVPLFPRQTVILVSRDDLELGELVLRHRGKGPLREMNLHHPRCTGLHANQAYYAADSFGEAAAG